MIIIMGRPSLYRSLHSFRKKSAMIVTQPIFPYLRQPSLRLVKRKDTREARN